MSEQRWTLAPRVSVSRKGTTTLSGLIVMDPDDAQFHTRWAARLIEVMPVSEHDATVEHMRSEIHQLLDFGECDENAIENLERELGRLREAARAVADADDQLAATLHNARVGDPLAAQEKLDEAIEELRGALATEDDEPVRLISDGTQVIVGKGDVPKVLTDVDRLRIAVGEAAEQRSRAIDAERHVEKLLRARDEECGA